MLTPYTYTYSSLHSLKYKPSDSCKMSGGPDTMSPSASYIQGMQSLSRYLPAQSLSITRTRYIASSRKWPRKVLSDPAVAHRVPLPCMYPKTMGKLEYVWISCSSKSYEERFIPSPKSCWSPAEDEQQVFSNTDLKSAYWQFPKQQYLLNT